MLKQKDMKISLLNYMEARHMKAAGYFTCYHKQ
jgi:hypothetical protein